MAIIRAADARARAREWRAQIRLQARFERKLRRDMAGIIRQAGKDAAEAFRAVGVVGVDIALREHRADVRGALTASYNGIMAVFGQRLIRSAPRGMGVPERKDTQDTFDVLVQRWIADTGAQKVVRITDTTRQQILNRILAGEAEGLGVDAIARSIVDETSGVIGRLRGAIIARTETHAASQAAQMQALEALDIPEVKREWVAAEDGRTRETHVQADGQIRAQNEAFDVGGAKLLHPGDPKGPPEEVINCRCIAASVVEN